MNNEQNIEKNPNIGFFVASVRTANGALPVENAMVTIYNSSPLDENGAPTLNDTDLLYSLRTDNSGRTEKIALETKSKDLSTVPGNEEPYFTYNVAVSANGFYDSEFIDVPIFQGITSIQTVNLMPVSEYGSQTDTQPDSVQRYVEKSYSNL